MKKKLKIAVTGGNGFIGTKILNELSKNKIRNISLQRKKSSYVNKNIVFYDLLKFNKNKMKFLSNVDVVIHTAALVHKGPMSRYKYLKSNYKATKFLVDQCIKYKVKKFIYLSTMSVYGLTSCKSKININFPVNPITNYAKSKLLSENYLLSKKKIKISILRLPSVYGINSPGNFGILEKLALKNIPLPFLGVKNKRSLISVDLVAKIVTKISLHLEKYLGLHLLCEKKAFSTEFIISKIRKKNKINSKLFFFPKVLAKLIFIIFGNIEYYKRIYENLEFVSTIKFKK